VDSSSKACKALAKQYGVAEARESIYGAMENLKWERCGTHSCQLNTVDPLSNITGECSLGRMAPYHVEAQEESDVINAVKFVRRNNIRLSIKNTGHDYFGRSSAANSLALWTHNLKQMEYHSTFTLASAPSMGALENIGIIGAGVTAGEALSYFEKYGMHVTIGAASSVGIAGGFGLGGGHGPLAPSYGLMVDQAVEFDVVTADGQFRTINEHNEPDLFWAMRGGGGSAFAVLVSYKFQLHPARPLSVHLVSLDIPLNISETTDLTTSKPHHDIATQLAMNQINWSRNNVAGYNFFFPNKFMSLLILPSQDSQALGRLTAQWSAYLASYAGISVAANKIFHFAKYTEFMGFVNSPEISKNGLIGVGIAESSRLIPTSQFADISKIDELVDAFLEGLQISLKKDAGFTDGYGQIYATTPFNTPDEQHQTSVNPAWRNSVWHVVYPGLFFNNETYPEQDQIFDTVGEAIKPLKKITPDGGAYLNEGDWKEEDWQRTFFGSNYDRLLKIKNQYDPDGLFKCWKCVGWTDNDE
jgi:FAD/FMN-containing dehydrogenase